MIAHFKKHSALMISLCATLALVSTGCAEKGEGGSSEKGEASESGNVPTTSNEIVYAKDWTELSLDANSAKSRVDAQGHFHTDKNMCQKAGDGVYSVTYWNEISAALNAAQDAATLPKARCWDSPNGSKFYNKGIAEMTISRAPVGNPNGTPVVTKRPLFTYKEGQICTTIADPALANNLISQIERALKLIDCSSTEDCQLPAETIAARCKID